MEKLKILDNDDLIRDVSTNAVLSKDNDSLLKYRARREKEKQLRGEVDNLKEELSEIKNLLYKLVKENNK